MNSDTAKMRAVGPKIHSYSSKIPTVTSKMHADAPKIHSCSSKMPAVTAKMPADSSKINSGGPKMHFYSSKIHCCSAKMHRCALKIDGGDAKIHFSPRKTSSFTGFCKQQCPEKLPGMCNTVVMSMDFFRRSFPFIHPLAELFAHFLHHAVARADTADLEQVRIHLHAIPVEVEFQRNRNDLIFVK